MNKPRRSPNIEEYKIQASILLKNLRGKEAEKMARRFKRLPEFANFSVEDILKKTIKHKHALALIAIENGFNSWLDLKMQVDFIAGGYLNSWFANYAEAKSHLQSTGGFLLPYKKQFFICSANYIEQIGFDPNDSDWKLIEYDWAMPVDKKAWQRLYKKWMDSKQLKVVQAKGDNHE